MPLFATKPEWELPRLTELPSWAEARRVAIDVETCDPDIKKMGIGVRHKGYMVGVSFAIEDGPSAYLPFNHLGGGNLPKDKVLEYLRDQVKVFRGEGTTIVGANLPYDIDYLMENGVDFKPHRFSDVQVAEPLLDELQMSYSLDNIALRHGLPGKDEDMLRRAAEDFGLDPKSELYKLPGTYVGAYAEQDVLLPLQLLRRQEVRLEDEGLLPIFDLESRVLPALVAMRRRGVRIDHRQLEVVEKWSLQRETEALEELYHATGVRVAVGDVWKAPPLASALEAIGIEVPRTAKTNAPSIKTDFLDTIKHPVAELIKGARRANKVRSTFVASVRRYAVGDRLHCTFNQLRKTDDQSGDEKGARFGRLSSCDLNLQQQPVRHPEIGSMWRKVYVPEPGQEWACADFSQQEPRWLTHYAALLGLPRAREVRAKYLKDPKTDNHDMMSRLVNSRWDTLPAKLKKQERDFAKTIFLGLCYGMGDAKLCHKLGLPTKWIERKFDRKMIEVAGDEGKALLKRFHAAVPYIKALSDRCAAKAQAKGYIITAMGRKCRFPRDESGAYDWTHKAGNRLIQGSGADQTKAALADSHEAGLPLQLQVHDELDLSIESRAQARELEECMLNATECSVPHLVDSEFGPSWGEIE